MIAAVAAARSILRSPSLRGAASRGRNGAAFPSSFRYEAEATLCGASLRQVSRRGELLCGNDAPDAQCHGLRAVDVDAHDFAQGLWLAVGSWQ